MSELLDIVDENDAVIGQAERDVAHAQGLKIRLVYVWFYTPDGRVILQRRSNAKKSSPGRLVSTVSGHVGSGMSYIEAACKETHEEAGIVLRPEDLQFFAKVYCRTESSGVVTAAFRSVYLYRFTGEVSDLVVEPGEGAGFEAWEVTELLQEMIAHPETFAPFLYEPISQELLQSLAQGVDS